MTNPNRQTGIFYSLILLIIFVFLFTSCASEANIMYQSDFKNEVNYSKWDMNSNDSIGLEEFYHGIFRTLDHDANNYLNKDEWQKINYYLGIYKSNMNNNFAKCDTSGNSKVGLKEITSHLNNAKLYEVWDQDDNRKLNISEFNSAIFDTWDINDDATLSSFEVENWREAAI